MDDFFDPCPHDDVFVIESGQNETIVRCEECRQAFKDDDGALTPADGYDEEEGT